MTKRALNETQMVDKLFDAISSGDASAITDAMELELTTDPKEEDEAPIEETLGAEEETSTDGQDTNKPEEDAPVVEEAAPPVKDWRDLLPDDVKDKVIAEFNSLAGEANRLNQYYKSNEGRVSGLQKKIDLLQQQLTTVQKPQSPSTNKPQQDAEADPVLDALREADPALYNALEVIRQKERAQYQQEVEKVRAELGQAIAPIQQREERDYVLREAAKVKAVVPDIELVLASDEWKTFMGSTNDKVRELAESRDADEFLNAVEIFTMYLHRTTPQAPQPAPVPQPNADAVRVQEARNKKLQVSTPTTRQPALAQGIELSEGDLLEKMFQDLRKKEGHTN